MNGNEIRQARERAGLTQGELGEQVGVSGRTVGNWERDFSIPRNKLAKVEQVLNVREHLGKESKLQDISDASLLAEIARRFDEGRTRKAGESNDSSMNQAEGNSADSNVHQLHETPVYTEPPPAESTAALHGVNRGRKMKEEQDRDAESPDVPGDYEGDE